MEPEGQGGGTSTVILNGVHLIGGEGSGIIIENSTRLCIRKGSMNILEGYQNEEPGGIFVDDASLSFENEGAGDTSGTLLLKNASIRFGSKEKRILSFEGPNIICDMTTTSVTSAISFMTVEGNAEMYIKSGSLSLTGPSQFDGGIKGIDAQNAINFGFFQSGGRLNMEVNSTFKAARGVFGLYGPTNTSSSFYGEISGGLFTFSCKGASQHDSISCGIAQVEGSSQGQAPEFKVSGGKILIDANYGINLTRSVFNMTGGTIIHTFSLKEHSLLPPTGLVAQEGASITGGSFSSEGALVANGTFFIQDASIRANGARIGEDFFINPIQLEASTTSNEQEGSITNSYLVLLSPNKDTAPIVGIDTVEDNFSFFGYKNDTGAAVWDDIVTQDDYKVPADGWIPCNYTVTKGQKFGPANSTVHVTLDSNVVLTNDGELYYPENFECAENAAIRTSISFDTQGGSPEASPRYIPYKTSAGIQMYSNLPSATKDDIKATWCFDPEGTDRIGNETPVRANAHALYAAYIKEPVPGTEDGWIESDAGWQYVLNGEFLNDGWHYFEDEYGNHWYYFDSDTYMATSRWIWDNSWEGWYWVCSTGPMIENLWQWIDNAWYGFWWGGKMCQGWVWDTYYVAWYYCDDYTGRVACNEWAWDGAWYYFDQNCQMLSNCWVGPYWLNYHGMWV